MQHSVIFYDTRYNHYLALVKYRQSILSQVSPIIAQYARYISLTFQLTNVWISYQPRYDDRFGIFSDRNKYLKMGVLIFCGRRKKVNNPNSHFLRYNLSSSAKTANCHSLWLLSN